MPSRSENPLPFGEFACGGVVHAVTTVTDCLGIRAPKSLQGSQQTCVPGKTASWSGQQFRCMAACFEEHLLVDARLTWQTRRYGRFSFLPMPTSNASPFTLMTRRTVCNPWTSHHWHAYAFALLWLLGFGLATELEITSMNIISPP